MGCYSSKFYATPSLNAPIENNIAMFDIPTTPPPSVTDPDQDRLVSIAANMGLYGKNKFEEQWQPSIS